MEKHNIWGILNPTEKTLQGFQMLRDVLAKENALLESEIYTLLHSHIQHQYLFDALRSGSQKQPLGSLSLGFFCPTPADSPDGSGMISRHLIGHVAVACIGVIDNLSEIQEKMFPSRFQFHHENAAETLSYLFSAYLELGYPSPVKTMQLVMNRLKGHFAIMVLGASVKWLMVGCRDYPLAIGKDNSTVYFVTDTDMLDLFSSKVLLVSGKRKSAFFCATSFDSSFQSEMILPVFL